MTHRWTRTTRITAACAALILPPRAAPLMTTAMTAAVATGPAASRPPTCRSSRRLGEPEGEVNILAWPGYAEDGSTDPAVGWVMPFEEETGCETNVKYFATSDEAVTLMKTGEYDVVSASGDAPCG